MTEAATKQEAPKKDPGTQLQTVSERFVGQVQAQFVAEMGSALEFTPYEKTLAQHMYLKVDAQIKTLAAKGTPIEWSKVNLQKLALDTVHRIGLGLDALIPNHIHPIPYLNSKTQKYDMDLRIGYVGEDYCRRAMAVEQPEEVIYQLVHDSDVFKPIMKGMSNEVESYEFEITSPFARGKVIGGFGYIRYTDPKHNRLIIVTQRDFAKAKASAKTMDFWGEAKFEEEMQFKTVVHRVAAKLPLDPKKINAQHYAYIEAQEEDAELEREIDENANKQVIDVTAEVVDEETGEVSPAQAPVTNTTPPVQEELKATGTEGPGY
jgi:recombination protein RecT